jgi:hypothetical protein
MRERMGMGNESESAGVGGMASESMENKNAHSIYTLCANT